MSVVHNPKSQPLDPDQWADRVLRDLSTMQNTTNRADVRVIGNVVDDVKALFSAGNKLVEARASATSSRHHDMLNLIGAIRGYAEMIEEAPESLHPDLRIDLKRLLLTATQSRKSTPDAIVGGSTPPTAEPGVILAVDDMPENRDLVTRLLTRAGHTVITAESGEEALELLTTFAVDVVLLDLMMPGIGGSEVLRRLKDSERLRATPVIMISGQQDMEQIVSCIQAGADDYLLKPFNPVLLQARIAAGIERKSWHDREQQYRQQLERNERFIRHTFGRYLSDDIVDELLENPDGLELGGDLRNVTIMMSDIRGFTTLSEQLNPQQIMRLLNRYLGRMTEVILEYGGTIDEFLGDAVLAVFGAPKRADDDAERAIRCALDMQSAMDDINTANRIDGLPELSMAIALNTGDVVAGNIGSERRSKYGFVGHNMNVTSRIEDHAGPNEVLAAQSTLDACRRRLTVGVRRSLSVKGLEEQLVVYPIESIEPRVKAPRVTAP